MKPFTNPFDVLHLMATDAMPSEPHERAHVVIVGAGFAGLEVVKELADSKVPVDITIIDKNNFHTFLPLLYQVATSGLNAADVAHPVRSIMARRDNVTTRQGRVTAVDWDTKTVEIADQAPLAFDHLVIAAGAAANDFGIPGVADFGFPLYNLQDAATLRNRILTQFEMADRDPESIEDGSLTFTIVGGGPTGVETAGALAELFDKVLRRDFPHLPISQTNVVLVEAVPHLLAPFGDTARQHAADALRERGVDLRLGRTVEEVTARTVTLDGGEQINSQTLIWAAGIKANPLAEAIGAEQGPAGRIIVAPDLSVPGREGLWVIGDIAHIDGPGITKDGERVPQLAPAAIQAGAHVATNIARQLRGEMTQPFRYKDKGTMATIGRRSAVTEIPGLPTLTGTPAWFAWLGLHLFLLVGFRNRASVMLNWAWNYLTWDRGPRLIFGPQRLTTTDVPEYADK